jgi:ATP-dependent DNA helicase RecG
MPLSDVELTALARDLESDRVERKASIADKGRLSEAVCAFANDLPAHERPGYLLVGVHDDGSPAGLNVTDDLLLTLAGLREDGNVLPLPSIAVERRVLDGEQVALVEVQPSSTPPVRYRGRVHIRIGPRRAIATAEEEARLTERRRASDLPFDARPLDSATIEDLDLDLFERMYLQAAIASDVLAENQRSTEHQLSALRLAVPSGTPTAAGVIVLGLEPASFVPGAYVQFLRVAGDDLASDIIAARDVHGPLPELIRETEEVLRAHLRVAVDLTSGFVEQRKPDYPFVALQQVLRNALMHRAYEATNAPVRITWLADRIEILSPGGPFGQVTPENFGTPGVTDYRNPTIAEAMRALGFVQRFGVGIATARRVLADNGNPAPDFRVESTYVSVTIRGT